ncbi:MAG: SDR family oxidoreductase [Oscillospiraceae bacterium]|jgi:3-oxoacyl-[acyl-carrier protein] reductase|nr:SDR family oxidoreductase [Oscillospiraceae bacterium]
MKTALVTGATGAMGAAIAAALEQQGLNVFRHGHCCAACDFLADLADETQVNALFRQAEECFGNVDILVNNAGIALPQQLITDTTTAEFDRVFAVDVRGVFLCCRRAIPHMVRQKWGRIVNISSMWGVHGASCEVAYSAAKAAVVGLTQALAAETAPSGVTVNCVAPGVINTPMNAHLSAADLAQLAADTPVGRLGTPEDVSHAVCFFADANASFVTGQTLLVDGGRLRCG